MSDHTIIIQGGLGNQLFQVFTLMNYCIENKCEYKFPRQMQDWDKYRHPYWETFFGELKSQVESVDENSYAEYIEPNFNYNEIPSFLNNTRLNGYFQTELYFKKNFADICGILNIKEKQEEIKHKYVEHNNSISLHFRMGDYVNPAHHPIMPDDYYIDSLTHIINTTQIEEWNVYYSCESIDDDVVMNRINTINMTFNHLNFIKIQNEMEDWAQMLALSVCKHNIIANSSFSWWGAHLNTNVNKIVCCPSVWFGPAKKNLSLKDLHPESWTRIILRNTR
jgi:hypothetical protein